MRRDVFQAIADPVRREIIDLLSKEPMNLNSVAEHFDISRPAISKHMKILSECGIVDIEQLGRERHCRIRSESLFEVSSWVNQYRALWEEKLDSLENYLNTIQQQKPKNDEPDT